jgi:hypothetical protein
MTTPALLAQTAFWPESYVHRELRRRVERLAADLAEMTPGTTSFDVAEARLAQAQARLNRMFGGAR